MKLINLISDNCKVTHLVVDKIRLKELSKVVKKFINDNYNNLEIDRTNLVIFNNKVVFKITKVDNPRDVNIHRLSIKKDGDLRIDLIGHYVVKKDKWYL